MNPAPDFKNFPLPAVLTRRVVTYLNVFRLFVSSVLILAFFTDLLVRTYLVEHDTIAGFLLIAYFVIGIYLALETRRGSIQPYFIAQLSLLIDILFLAIYLFVFGSQASGLAVLLIFAAASAAILLPLRIALFLGSLVVLVLIGESVTGILSRDQQIADLLKAGIYGVTTFIIIILVNLLSFRVRDYRLLAERQAQDLTRLEQVNELIIRRMRSGVLAVDASDHIQMMNESAWFLLGNPASQDRPLAEISVELAAVLKDWRANPSIEIEPLRLQASQARVVPKFVSLPGSSDISELIFLEDNDVVAQRALELTTSSLAKLSGSIAHEIRNPLAAVSHAAQLLGETEGISPADARLIEIINNQSRRMNDIVENILQLSRQEKSRPDIVDLKAWLKDISDEFTGALRDMSVDLSTDFPEEEVLVLFDRSQLHQVIWKLMDNAMRHAKRENSAPLVKIKMRRLTDTGYCVVSVEDDGPGISEHNIERIFEPFYTTHKQGSGLGLYIARQLCEANQAELTVDSSPHGTRFHIRVAVARSDRSKLRPTVEGESQMNQEKIT